MARLPPLVVALLLWAFVGGATPALASDGQSVTVFQPGGLSGEVEAVAWEVAKEEGARVAVFHTGTLGLLRVEREGRPVQVAPAGFRYPMATMAVDPHRTVRVIGVEAANALAAGQVVLGATSARLRGAQVGDEVELLGWDGAVHRLRVGAVVADELIHWAELSLSDRTAASMGMSRPSYALLWELADPGEVRAALAARLPEDEPIGVRGSDDPPDPDRVLPTALIKERFGEFAYRPTGPGDRVQVDPRWEAENIVWVELPHLGRFRCHRLLVPYLETVVDELQANGLIYQLDPDDFQRNGGCYHPRRIRGGDKGGALSRHAWGVAIDLNPSRNPYGGEVVMSRGIVEAFRRSGFAWGGSWTYPDGGHFEWSRRPEETAQP